MLVIDSLSFSAAARIDRSSKLPSRVATNAAPRAVGTRRPFAFVSRRNVTVAAAV